MYVHIDTRTHIYIHIYIYIYRAYIYIYTYIEHLPSCISHKKFLSAICIQNLHSKLNGYNDTVDL
jgi:hypothetical protein